MRVVCLLLFALSAGAAQQGLPKITLRSTAPPPEWALWQRFLLREYWPVAQEFVTRYTSPDGTLIWRKKWPGMDGSDDGYEAFYNFPLYHALGGHADMDPLSRKLWGKVTELFTRYGTVTNEFDTYYDWMHHGESYVNFYFFGLSNPYEPAMRARALKFAALYMSGPNWDPVHLRITSPITGAKGPRFENSAEDWVTHREVLSHYPLPYDDIPEVRDSKAWVDDKLFPNILSTMNRRMMKADVPLNLASTSMIANAYFYTGEEKYRQWIERYVDAWMKRVEANGGVIPDNVGPNGKIGETMDGKWYGGYYGWRWPHGLFNQLEATMIGGANAYLVSGDARYLELPRSQQEFMFQKSKVENGRRLVANRHGDQGWYDWRPAEPQYPVNLWYLSFARRDEERLRSLVDVEALARAPYRKAKGDDKHEFPWLRFLQGENPAWPVEMLQANWAEAQRRLDNIRHDRTDPEDMDVHHWQQRNPLILEGLVQQTMGGPNHIYHGGLLQVRLRWFDAERKRAGLPEDVAALVDRVTENSVRVRLVNTSGTKKRETIVQAGAFGEHMFQGVQVEGEGAPVVFNGRHLWIELPPGASSVLTLKMKRYEYKPTYEFPTPLRPR